MKTVYRGEVYYAELSPVIGSEQGGIRPVLILQNNTGNRHSPTTIIVLKLFQKLAVSKGSHLRQSLWSLSAESETLYTS